VLLRSVASRDEKGSDPELNPLGNVWQYMRDNWLSNRIFKSYDDLVDHCCEAWNKLVDQPWRIMSLGLRQWAHEF
jgi:transposase